MQHKKSYSQFQAMMAVARASLRSTTRSPSAVIFTIFFPLIFIVAFGFIGGGGFTMKIAPVPGMDTLNPIYQALHRNPALQFVNKKSQAETDKEFSKGHIDAFLDIKKEMSQNGPHYLVNVTTSTASKDKGSVFRMIVTNVVNGINLGAAHVTQPVAEIKTTETTGRKYSMIDFILPGMLGFSILSTGVFGTAFVFLSLRQTLVIKRFFATPVNRMYIVLGEALSRLVFSLAGALIIILIGYFAFHFTLIHGFVTVLNMLILSAIGLIIFMGFGFTISGIAKTESSVPPLANIITLPQFLLSGTFFGIEAFPPWLQAIAKVLPLTYMNDAMRQIAFDGASLYDVRVPLLILLAWGVGVYLLAAKLFRWE
jgi:ABC-2 type transport system permease protein